MANPLGVMNDMTRRKATGSQIFITFSLNCTTALLLRSRPNV